MIDPEIYPEAGLTVIRRGIDPVLASAMAYEWLDKLNPELAGWRKLYPNETVFHMGSGIRQLSPRFKATHRILEELGGEESFNAFHVNYQLPLGAQSFHTDTSALGKVVAIVHGSPNGVFDYAIGAQNKAQAEAKSEPLEFNAGDVVLQKNVHMFHRGRNGGNEPRITGVFSWMKLYE